MIENLLVIIMEPVILSSQLLGLGLKLCVLATCSTWSTKVLLSSVPSQASCWWGVVTVRYYPYLQQIKSYAARKA